MKYLVRVTSAILGSISLLAVFTVTPVFAATTSASTTQNLTQTNTLKISPLRTDLKIKPGDSTVVKVTAYNLSSVQTILEPLENDFVAGSKEDGTPAIILDQTQYAPTHSLKRFMSKLPSTITVPANGSTDVSVTITVPSNAQAGGYFGAIRFVPAGSAEDKQVNLTTSAASLILLTVPGPTVENLSMTNFDIQQDGTTSGHFGSPKDLGVLLRFKNEGNVQEAPFGQIYVQKGKKVLYTYSFNQQDPKSEILPDSARRWTVPLKGFGKFGKYTIGATFTYGANKTQTVQITKQIWIIPGTVILGVIGGIILLIVIIVAIIMGLRAYKRRIMRHARRYR